MVVERAATAGAVTPGPHRDRPDFVVVGTNHRYASIDVRERLADDASLGRIVSVIESHATVPAHLLLSTCNRIEVWFFGTVPDPVGLRHDLASALDAEPEAFYVHTQSVAIEHAIRVSSGMDSMAWGEPQVGAQVLESLALAKANGWARNGLPELVHKVAAAAGRVRRIARAPPGSGSASDAAVNLILSKFSDRRATVLVVGTGKMGRLAARHLATSADLVIADRTPAKAEGVARALGALPLPIAECINQLGNFDALVIATSATHAVLTTAMVSPAVRDRVTPILIIDLSVPRNVEPEVGDIPTVELVNLDDLQPWATPPPGDVLERAEHAIRSEATQLAARLRSRAADETITRLRKHAEAVRREELSSASRRVPGLAAEARAVVEKMTERIVNRLLHDPTQAIRTTAAKGESAEYERLVRELFGLKEDPP